MKNLLKLFALAALFSCGGKEEKSSSNILENLSFTVDTLVIDAGGDFLNLGYGLGPHRLSQDGNRLFFFENDPHRLVEVDLQQRKVLKKTEFEKEGPNGVGPYLSGMEIDSDGTLFLQSYTGAGLFDQNAKKTRDLRFAPEGIDPNLAQNHSGLYSRATYDFGTGKVYTQPHIESAGEYGLFILDPATKTARSLPIPEMKIVDDYSGAYVIKSGTSLTKYYFGLSRFTTHLPGELILSASAMSGIYRFDTKTENLEFIQIQHQTVPNVMELTITKNPTDEASFQENRRRLAEHLNYMEMRWDETRGMYLRFGQKTFQGKEKGDRNTYELFLFAYDRDFKVLGETKIEGLKQVPSAYFWKDGKLWSYVNVEDELGFAVMDFKF